jgi:hypothetical protein
MLYWRAHPRTAPLTVSLNPSPAFNYPDRHGKTDMSDRAFAIFLALELAFVFAIYAAVG